MRGCDVRDFDLPPRVDDDPAGRDRGQRSVVSLTEEMAEWDALVEEHGVGCWDCDRVRAWLTDAR